MSDASEKQRKINDLLNASHNSQAERDYLRHRILEIFEEDENALGTFPNHFFTCNWNRPVYIIK